MDIVAKFEISDQSGLIAMNFWNLANFGFSGQSGQSIAD